METLFIVVAVLIGIFGILFLIVAGWLSYLLIKSVKKELDKKYESRR